MTIQSASAKLYTGIRCWCVDKNVSANLTSAFTTGHFTVITASPLVMGPPVLSGILATKLRRYLADLVVTPTVSLASSPLLTTGFGNNVITPGSPRVIDNTNNWKITAGVVCKFPTYFRIDVDKLQLPEGVTCTVSFEEGWIKDGDYLESPHAANLAIPNFFTFRTPKFGVAHLNTIFSIPTKTVLRIKQLGSTVSSQASITAHPIYNPGRFAALFGGVFTTLTAPIKKVKTSATLTSYFGPLGPGGIPELATITKIKQLNSDIISASSVIIDALIVIVADSSITAISTVNATVTKFKGMVNNNLSVVSTLTAAGVNTVSGIDLMAFIANITATIGKSRSFTSTLTSMASLSSNVTNIQRSPRWEFATSYTIALGGGGGYILPLSGSDFTSATPSAGVTTFRRYTSGVYSSDTAGVLITEKRQVDINASGFWVASNGIDAVVYSQWQGASNTPIYLQVPSVAVDNIGAKFILYDQTAAYAKIYDTSGTHLTAYDNIALNYGVPRDMIIQTVSGSSLFVAASTSINIRFMRYGTSWNTQTIAITDTNEINVSSDGLMLAVSNVSNNAVYIFTRTSTSVNFTLVQTISESYSNMYLHPGKQFLFLGNRTFMLIGSTFTYVRDVNYPSGAGALTFGNDTETTQIISTTASTYHWI